MISLEQMLCSPRFFDLPATPVQRAITRAADGNPLDDLAKHPDVIAAFGGEQAIRDLPVGSLPSRFDFYSGIRTAKSLLASAAALCMSQRVDVSKLRVGELPRIPILSLDLDKSRVVLDHLVGTITSKPALKALLAEEPKGDSIVLWHPRNVKIEIMCVAGKRAGGALVARWLGGVVFDEAPRMVDADEGVVNIEDALAAAEGRILPGGQIWCIGSPYAPWGESFESVRKHWGAPSRHRVVAKAPAMILNPVWWTPGRCEDLKATNPRAWRCDVMAEFADASSSALPSEWVDRAMRSAGHVEPLGPRVGIVDSAAGGGDAFTSAIGQVARAPQVIEYEGEEIAPGMQIVTLDAHGNYKRKANPTPSRPFTMVFGWCCISGKFRESLTFDDVVARIAAHFASFGVTRAIGDQYQGYALESAFARHGIRYSQIDWTNTNKTEMLARARNWFRDGDVIIEGGAETEAIRRELVQLQEKPTASGGTSIGARRGGHDDRAAIILNLAAAESIGELRGSPMRKDRGVYSAT